MKSIFDQYKSLNEGKLSEAQFLRNVKMALPKFISNTVNFKDAVKILKNKGIITEAKAEPQEYGMANDWCNPQEYDLGMRYEIEKGTDEDKADKIVKKNLKDNVSYYSQLHLAGYNEDAMKTDRKKRTDLPVEVKDSNVVDTANGTKKVKADKLTEDEIKMIIGKVLTEALENGSEPISINDLTYEKAIEMAGKPQISIQTSSAGVSSIVRDSEEFDNWKERILRSFDGNDTLSYYPGYGFRFTDQSRFDKESAMIQSFYDKLKYKGD